MKKQVIGLTGILGSGKSLVADFLAAEGAVVIDMDQAGRYVVDHSKHVRRALRSAFGESIFDEQNRLKRNNLADLVFSDPESLTKLNRIVHPVMLERARKLITDAQQASNGCCLVVDAALLFELGFDAECDKVVTVVAPLDLCLERAVQFKKISREQALRRIQVQLSQGEKEKRADHVLVNDGSTALLRKRVAALLPFLLAEN
ncbi:MAG: dephospho-CoA kinase [Calditrichaeota bacterium]|nr:MAG: dephospho-CoA kinase [Calditrichota bacterium]